MLNRVNPTHTRSWRKLADHYNEMKEIHMIDLFEKDPHRFHKFSLRLDDILVDFSKNRITDDTFRLLVGLADEISLGDSIEKMLLDSIAVSSESDYLIEIQIPVDPV